MRQDSASLKTRIEVFSIKKTLAGVFQISFQIKNNYNI